jgi:hypothetical protein
MKNTIKLIGIIVLVMVMIFSMTACRGRAPSGTVVDAPAQGAVIEEGVDKILSDFEKLIDDHVSLIQKAADGDVAAATQLVTASASFVQNLTEFSTQLYLAEERGEVTEAHRARAESISERIDNLFD